jgi:hypothetical protein
MFNIMFNEYNCNNIFKYYLFLFINIDDLKIENKNNYDQPVKSMYINDR